MLMGWVSKDAELRGDKLTFGFVVQEGFHGPHIFYRVETECDEPYLTKLISDLKVGRPVDVKGNTCAEVYEVDGIEHMRLVITNASIKPMSY